MTTRTPAGWTFESKVSDGVWRRQVVLNHPDGTSNPPRQWHGFPVRNVRPVYWDEPFGIPDIRAELNEIVGCCSAMRQSGPAPEDLDELYNALDRATSLADDLSARLMFDELEPIVAMPEEMTAEMEGTWRGAFLEQARKRRNPWGRASHPDSCEQVAYRALRNRLKRQQKKARQ